MKFNFDQLEFEEVEINGGKLAISGSDRDVSWNELLKVISQIEKLFQEVGIPKGHPVILFGHKEFLFPILILACIKNGIPYIPIDCFMPDDRIRKIKEASRSQVLITVGEKIPHIEFPIHIHSDLTLHIHSKPQFANVEHDFGKDVLSYIMFTSGSTGEPKGVMIGLESVRSFIHWLKRDFPISESTVFMNQAAFSFDISLTDVLGALSLGGTLVLIDSSLAKSPLLFLEKLKTYKCTLWNSTPSFAFIYLTEPTFVAENLPDLRSFLFAGEELTARVVKKLNQNFPSKRIFNAYGPTEATVYTTLIEITQSVLNEHEKSLPIGFPRNDGEVIIANGNNHQEESGELIIVGDHVGHGYLNNPKLSAEKFRMLNGKRSYKTGDFGFYKDGVLFFNGRKDDQVKLNGYRIEVGEITELLLKHENVMQAESVPLRSKGQVKKIVSFVKLKRTASAEEDKDILVQFLSMHLPAYMIPGDITFVLDFPVNTNHKIDKGRLIEDYLAQ